MHLQRKQPADQATEPTVSILIPCWNEEATIERCIESALAQEVKAEQIIVIDDCSVDRSPEILARYSDRITVVRPSVRSGNKSYAQEYGLQFVTSDVVVTTDADTILDSKLVYHVRQGFTDPKVAAMGGYVKSLKHNWLTRCRALEYSLGQNLYKRGQSYIDYMFVIPGAAGAFRTDIFREYLTFDHDTITEDLDFTYKLHKHGFKIEYNPKVLVYTQDPATMHSYINQVRRWYGGGYQCLMKHRAREILHKPAQVLELSLMYIEGVVFSALFFVIPLINLRLSLYYILPSIIISTIIAVYASIKERRADILLAPIPYLFLMYVNAYIFLEQFVKHVILRRKAAYWFKPERVHI